MLWICALCQGLCNAGPVTSDVPEAVTRHIESRSQLKSYHVAFSAWRAPELGDSLVHESDVEVWCTGSRVRTIRRQFYIVGGRKGLEKTGGDEGRVTEFSVDDLTLRQVQGWDPLRPKALPLEWGRNAKEFDAISCSISPRDPNRSGQEEVAMALMWQVVSGVDLSDLAERSQLRREADSATMPIRLHVSAVSGSDLSDVSGAAIDVDPEHGWIISRVSLPVPGGTFVRRVVDVFDAGDGTWAPRETVSTFNGQEIAKVVVHSFEANPVIPASQLITEFPHGARVVEAPSGRIHLWGQKKPERTFSSETAFRSFLYAQARDCQAQGKPKHDPVANSRPETFWILIANAVLFGLLILFTMIRRRMARSGDPPDAAS